MDFIKEVLRLYPPILFLTRKIGKDPVILGQSDENVGFPIPSGASVYLSVYHSHRNPNVWDNPNEFDPSRYTNNSRKGKLLTFSDYSTTCLGKHFAEAVIRSLLANLILTYEICPPVLREGQEEQNLKIKTGMTLRFDSDLELRLVPRFF